MNKPSQHKCPKCNGKRVKIEPATIQPGMFAGKLITCKRCGYFWSEHENGLPRRTTIDGKISMQYSTHRTVRGKMI